MAFSLNTPQFPDILHAFNFQALNIFLQFFCVDDTTEPSIKETAYRKSGSS